MSLVKNVFLKRVARLGGPPTSACNPAVGGVKPSGGGKWRDRTRFFACFSPSSRMSNCVIWIYVLQNAFDNVKYRS